MEVLQIVLILLMSIVLITIFPKRASAHCDTMDGPTVADGIKAMEINNINYVLKWIQPEDEKELTEKFNLSMKVKDLSPDAKQLSEQYFFSELIRLHRAGEGAPFEGLKPSGTPIDEVVIAADKCIEVGNLTPLDGMIEKEKLNELKVRFDKVISLKGYDINDVKAGREYVEAYVNFFKFAEGEEHEHIHKSHNHHTN